MVGSVVDLGAVKAVKVEEGSAGAVKVEEGSAEVVEDSETAVEVEEVDAAAVGSATAVGSAEPGAKVAEAEEDSAATILDMRIPNPYTRFCTESHPRLQLQATLVFVFPRRYNKEYHPRRKYCHQCLYQIYIPNRPSKRRRDRNDLS